MRTPVCLNTGLPGAMACLHDGVERCSVTGIVDIICKTFRRKFSKFKTEESGSCTCAEVSTAA